MQNGEKFPSFSMIWMNTIVLMFLLLFLFLFIFFFWPIFSPIKTVNGRGGKDGQQEGRSNLIPWPIKGPQKTKEFFFPPLF